VPAYTRWRAGSRKAEVSERRQLSTGRILFCDPVVFPLAMVGNRPFSQSSWTLSTRVNQALFIAIKSNGHGIGIRANRKQYWSSPGKVAACDPPGLLCHASNLLEAAPHFTCETEMSPVPVSDCLVVEPSVLLTFQKSINCRHQWKRSLIMLFANVRESRQPCSRFRALARRNAPASHSRSPGQPG
jgi:hypothetical protein